MPVRRRERLAHRRQIRGGDQPVTAPSDGEGPNCAGELAVHRLHQPAQFLVGRTALNGRTGVDHHQVRVGRYGMDHLQVHGGFPVSLARHATDHLRGEAGHVEPVGVAVHILLFEAIEAEHHHGGALAGVTLPGQRRDVVRTQQLGRQKTTVGDVAGRGGRYALTKRGVAQDPTESSHLPTGSRWDLRLLW